jgi:hypothetical protein
MISSTGRTRNFLPLYYMAQKAHLLCGQARVAWITSEPASLGGL